MTNNQRLLFIQHQLEMLQGVAGVAYLMNTQRDLTVLYVDVQRKIADLQLTVAQLNSATLTQ